MAHSSRRIWRWVGVQHIHHYRSEAVDLVRKTVGNDFGYNPDLDPQANENALEGFCDYLKKSGRAVN